MPSLTKPCEYCGVTVTRTGTQQSQRTYWTCGRSCANKLRIERGNVPKSWLPNPFRGQQETRPCAECGNSVTRHLNEKNVGRSWFDSVSCRARYMARKRLADETFVMPRKPRRGITSACPSCGTSVYLQAAYVKEGRRFCSRDCWNVEQRRRQVKKDCGSCGKEMTLRPSESTRMYCSHRCWAVANTVRPAGRDHNGRAVIINAQGYLTIYEPTHPSASRTGRVLEHRWVMEQSLGRYLSTREQVDHINRDKTDNRIENLQLMTPTAHSIKTNTGRKQREVEMAQRLAEYERRFGALE